MTRPAPTTRPGLTAAAAAVARTGASDAVSYLSVEPVAATDAYYRGRLAAESVGHALYRVPAIRSTRQPAARIAASRIASRAPPSSSTTSRASTQAKSAT